MSKFEDAPVKGEGSAVQFEIGDLNESFPTRFKNEQPEEIETRYVERRVPIELEEEAHTLIEIG